MLPNFVSIGGTQGAGYLGVECDPFVVDNPKAPVSNLTLAPGIDQPRLGRVQRQAGLRRPALHLGQRRGRFGRAATQHHEVVCVAHHLIAPLGHQVVERVEVDVAQKRA